MSIDKNQLPVHSGIYKIINLITNKYYIGSALNIKNRINNHLKMLKRGNHHSSLLQNSWVKHGYENFTIEIICCVLDRQKLYDIEQLFLDEYKTYEKEFGYNISKNAHGGSSSRGENHYLYGKSMPEETKEKLRAACSGSNSPRYGKKNTAEHIEKVRLKTTGRKVPEEKNKQTQEKRRKNFIMKPFICNETGDVFTNTWDAKAKLNNCKLAIRACLRKDSRQKHTYGYSFRYTDE